MSSRGPRSLELARERVRSLAGLGEPNNRLPLARRLDDETVAAERRDGDGALCALESQKRSR